MAQKDQLLELPPHLVYQGGAAPGVQCVDCRATSTSGSWRRGWALTAGGHSNLCNRCGQRYVKLERLAMREGQGGQVGVAVPRPKAQRREALPSLAGGPPSDYDVKRAKLAATMAPSHSTTSAAAPLGGPRRRPRLLSESTSDELNEAPAGMSLQGAQLPYPVPMLRMPIQQGGQPRQPPPPPQQQQQQGQLASARFTSYCIQKQTCGRTSVALFWVQDDRGSSTLAVMGVDPRASGHFTYTAAPGMRVDAPLRCTNRGEVLNWLAAVLGVERAVPESAATLPPLTQEDLQRLVVPGDGGKQERERPLSSAGGPQLQLQLQGRGLPTAEDAAGMASLSGSFEGGHPAEAGLRPGDDDDDEGDAVIADASPRRPMGRGAKLKPQRPAMRFSCGACGRIDHSVEDCPLGCLSPSTLIHNQDSASFLFLEDPVLGCPQDNLLLACGADDDSPMQETIFEGLSSFMELSAPTANTPGTGSPGAVTQPERAFAANHITLQSPAAACLPPLRILDGVRQLTPAAEAAFQPSPQLHSWVTEVPSQHVEDTFRGWAERLSGHVSETPPPPPASAAVTPLGGIRWVPTSEALSILQQLSTTQVNLALLERTHISRAVAMLRTHSIAAVASAAEGVVARWRASAVAALSTATASGARQP